MILPGDSYLGAGLNHYHFEFRIVFCVLFCVLRQIAFLRHIYFASKFDHPSLELRFLSKNMDGPAFIFSSKPIVV